MRLRIHMGSNGERNRFCFCVLFWVGWFVLKLTAGLGAPAKILSAFGNVSSSEIVTIQLREIDLG